MVGQIQRQIQMRMGAHEVKQYRPEIPPKFRLPRVTSDGRTGGKKDDDDPEAGIHGRVQGAVVKRVKDGQSVGAVARELGLIEQTLRNSVKAFDGGRLNGSGVRKVTLDEMELSRLRAENIRLKRENEILKKATAYFTRDAL